MILHEPRVVEVRIPAVCRVWPEANARLKEKRMTNSLNETLGTRLELREDDVMACHYHVRQVTQ